MMNKRTIILSFIIILGSLFLYRFSPYKLDFIGHYNTKIGAHKCNNSSKLNSALKYYDRIELDLVYNEEEKFLDVYHPPNPSTGLTFKNYISKIPNNKFPFLWLDIQIIYTN